MPISDLKYVQRLFGGGDVSAGHEGDLFKEVLLMTLARAANADVSIQNVEVDRIRAILKQHTGEEFSAADVRVAAREELYAEATLVKYLRGAQKRLTDSHCTEIVQALADVFRSDKSISVLEVDFFNNVVAALNVTPAQIAGLTAGDID